MEYIELKAQDRAQIGKTYSKTIRAQGKAPAVVYGLGKEPRKVEVVIRDIDKIFNTKLGVNNLIHLSYNSGGDDKVMIKDYQGDPITRFLTHVDFIRVDETKEVRLQIPVKFMGRAEGIKEGGVEDHVSRVVDLICRPGYIPTEIEVDVTPLKIGQSLHLADVKLPAQTRISPGYNPTLVTIFLPKVEEVKPEEATVPSAGAAPAAGAAAPAAGAAAPAAGAAPAAAAKPAADKKK